MTSPTRKRLLERGPDGKPTFEYKSAANTNIAATFARIRKEMARMAAPSNVKQLKRAP